MNPQIPPTKASDMMVSRLIALRPTTKLASAISLMLKHGISGMPVIDENDRYQGVFSEKCCMRALQSITALIEEPWKKELMASDFMIPRKNLHTLKPEDDVFEAIQSLLRHRVSGAPVTNRENMFQGVFSEKTSMRVVIDAAYEGIPTTRVECFTNPDRGRFITEKTTLLDVVKIFIDTPYRRLPVVEGDKVLGQISRRDVLKSSVVVQKIVQYAASSPDSPMNQKPGNESMIILKAQDLMPSDSVGAFMDTKAKTIPSDKDLLSIAQLFWQTPYRRFPVVEDGICVGQVSRRDVLAAAFGLLDDGQLTDKGPPLFLSAVEGSQAPQL